MGSWVLRLEQGRVRDEAVGLLLWEAGQESCAKAAGPELLSVGKLSGLGCSSRQSLTRRSPLANLWKTCPMGLGVPAARDCVRCSFWSLGHRGDKALG